MWLVVGGRTGRVVVEAASAGQRPEPTQLVVRCRIPATDVVEAYERGAGRDHHEVLVL